MTSLAVVAAAVASANTSTAPNFSRLAETPRLLLDRMAPQTENVIIDFENVQGPQSGAGIELSGQYADGYGVTFDRGVSVHYCRDSEFTATRTVATLCPYPQAASGQFAAVFDTRSGGPAMGINFYRQVSSVSAKINPTGGTLDEVFSWRINGYDADGELIAEAGDEFNWFQDAFTWPTEAALDANGGRLARVTMQLNDANGAPVRFLIDDLEISYAPDLSDTPVLAALANRPSPPPVREAPAALLETREGAAANLRRYKAASRVRAPIDWDAVDEVLGQQKDRNMRPIPARLDIAMDRAKMPLLLPAKADDGSMSVVGNDDSYHASFTVGGYAYSLYGTRVLTLIDAAKGAPKPDRNMTELETDYSLVVSFSLFGASYTLTRYCKNDSAAEDPSCFDRDAMGDVLKDIVVEVGNAGRQRP